MNAPLPHFTFLGAIDDHFRSQFRSQSGGQFVGGNSAFNAGLGGDHASAGIHKDGHRIER
jgi:hypothetical protein